MSIRTVGELRAQLEPFPDYRPLVVEVTVGGDLVTDDVDLLELEETGGSEGAYVRLRHAPDEYDVRALIDDGLEHRAQVERDEDTRARRLRQLAGTERHCHADGQGPCLAGDCPIAGQRPRSCPGAPGPQHPVTPRT